MHKCSLDLAPVFKYTIPPIPSSPLHINVHLVQSSLRDRMTTGRREQHAARRVDRRLISRRISEITIEGSRRWRTKFITGSALYSHFIVCPPSLFVVLSPCKMHICLSHKSLFALSKLVFVYFSLQHNLS